MNFPNTPVFPQPNGNVYVLNSMNEFPNIPTTAGLSVGICLNENLVSMRSLQNGAPAQLTYKLVPIEPAATGKYDERLNEIEEKLSKIIAKLGGEKVQWQV